MDKNGVEQGPASEEEISWRPDIPEAGVGFDKGLTVVEGESELPVKPVTIQDKNGHVVAAFDRIGTFYKGLASFLQKGKLGFVGADGSIVIPASYPVDTTFYDGFVFNEDLLVLNVGQRVGIVRITRS